MGLGIRSNEKNPGIRNHLKISIRNLPFVIEEKPLDQIFQLQITNYKCKISNVSPDNL